MDEVVVAALVREGRVLLVRRSLNRRVPGCVGSARWTHRDRRDGVGCAHEGAARGTGQLSAWLLGDWQGTPTNVAPDEHDEIRWFRHGELPPLAHERLGTALVDAMRATGPELQRTVIAIRAVSLSAPCADVTVRFWWSRKSGPRGANPGDDRVRLGAGEFPMGSISGCPSQNCERRINQRPVGQRANRSMAASVGNQRAS